MQEIIIDKFFFLKYCQLNCKIMKKTFFLLFNLMAFSLFADDNNSNSNSTLNSKEGIVLNQEFQIELYQKVSSLKEGLTLELDLMNEDPPPGSPHSYYPPYILRVISHKNW
jgi:hypothetical protein